MQAFWTLTRRELGTFFVSLTGYVILAAVVFQIALSYVILMEKLQNDPTPMPLAELFYITPFFWLILLLVTPVVTMRLFAQEKSSGTYETLMTAPVNDLQVVLAKFTAGLTFFMILWLPLLAVIFILRHYTNDNAALDPAALGSTYLGIFLLGCLYVSMGCFASSLTSSQITAAMTSFVIGIALFMLSFLAENIPTHKDWVSDLFSFISMTRHMEDFARGVVDTRPVIYYLSFTLFFLFLTYRVVESRRWK